MHFCLRRIFVAVLIAVIVLPLSAQQQPSPSQGDSSQYPNSVEGLRTFLNEMLAAARTGDTDKLSFLVKETEIPNYAEYFHRMYSPDKAESWIRPYGDELAANEQALREQFAQIARKNGKIDVRKLVDIGDQDRGLEWALLHSAREPLDIYAAGWTPASDDSAQAHPIGYFIYIDGVFRWDSTIHFVTPKIVHSTPANNAPPRGLDTPVAGAVFTVGPGITPPRALSTVYPKYSEAARQARVQGTVVLSIVVDVDGRAKDISVIHSLGSGLDEEAVAAVRRWKFTPAKKGGQAVPVRINIEEQFNLAN